MVQQLASPIKFQTKCGKAIEQFLLDKEIQSKNTARGYRSDIENFLYTVYDGRTINTITTEELDILDYDIFFNYTRSFEDVSNGTINRHISTVRSLFKQLKRRKFLESDITYLDEIKLLPKDSIRIEGMTREVVLNYIEGAAKLEKNHSLAKQNLIMFAVDTALRLEDYLDLKWTQFTPQDEYVSLRGYGKGNKEWLEKISYDVYNSLLELNEGQSKVFAPLNEKNVTDMMRRLKTQLGYEDRAYSFHSFKKTGVTFTYRLTGDAIATMKKAKHSNFETTLNYIEEIDYGMTGMFSLGDHDPDSYKKITHEELLTALNEMNKDTLHLLNIKISNLQKRNK